MKHVKITDSSGQTKNNTQWGKNITHEITTPGTTLCSKQVFHGYYDEYVAVFMSPIHGDYGPKTMQLWEAKGVKVADDGTKMGFKKQTTIKQIPIPIITTEQRTEIAIRVALTKYKEESFKKWAKNWLSNNDRTPEAAWAAARAAEAAAWAAAEAAARAAEAAAWAAARAAEAAARAAARAAEAAAWAAARAAEAAAWAAAEAAEAAARAAAKAAEAAAWAAARAAGAAAEAAARAAAEAAARAAEAAAWAAEAARLSKIIREVIK